MTERDCRRMLLVVTFLLGIATTKASADIIYQGIDFQSEPFGDYGGVALGNPVGSAPSYFNITSLLVIPNPAAYYGGFGYGFDFTQEGFSLSDGSIVDVSGSGTALEFGPDLGFWATPVLPTSYLVSGDTNFQNWSFFKDSYTIGDNTYIYFSPGDTSNTETVFGLQNLADPSNVVHMVDSLGGDGVGVPLTPGNGVYVNIPYFDVYGNPLPGAPQYQLLIGNLLDDRGFEYTVGFLETGDRILSESPEPASWVLTMSSVGALALLWRLRLFTISARQRSGR